MDMKRDTLSIQYRQHSQQYVESDVQSRVSDHWDDSGQFLYLEG